MALDVNIVSPWPGTYPWQVLQDSGLVKDLRCLTGPATSIILPSPPVGGVMPVPCQEHTSHSTYGAYDDIKVRPAQTGRISQTDFASTPAICYHRGASVYTLP